MAEYHHFLAYGNGKYKGAVALDTKRVSHDMWDTPSDKQIAYHKALLAFMESKGLDTLPFKKYRDRRELRGKISAILTVIRKSGLDAEFFSNREGQDA